eukprot:Phypoly_transcript_04056.p1 GENE.Phypoly_transcript_04056~~Phypoly_transcript_04056.p1  ORF type:complete len:720 (+),score=149.53 Phypoly_transcript_04056:104-2263(+)
MSFTTTTSSNDELVKLNVGGKLFTTYKSTLMTYPDTMWARMFSSSAEIAKKGPDGEYFLDRNPDLFAIVLEFYRNKALIVPKGTPMEALHNELQFFGIEYEEDDIQIAGEPTHVPVECYFSLVNAYSALPKKGHLLGGVVIGLPQFDYEEDEEEEEEDEEDEDEDGDDENGTKKAKQPKSNKKDQATRELFEGLSKGLKDKRNFLSNLGNDSDESSSGDDSGQSEDGSDSGSPPKKKVKQDNKNEEPENDEYENGTAAVLEKIRDTLSEIATDSVFCCGGYDEVKNSSLVIKPLPSVDPNSNNNNNNAADNPNPQNKPTCQYGADCYRKNPQHIADFYHPPPGTPCNSSVLFGKQKKKFDDGIDCGDLPNLKIDLVKSLCTPAPFGDLKTMQTKLDPNVRVALECNSDRFEFQTNLRNVTRYIKAKLNNDKNVELTPYKLNIYEPGGFFKEHVDTPVNPGEMIGSLVVCLPSEHEGGELIVSHNGISQTFDFSQKSANKNLIQWAAFYSDCIHEVKPVTKGTRITVTFLVSKTDAAQYYYGKPDFKKNQFFCGPVDATMSTAKIDSLLEHMSGLPTSVKKFGLFLSHKYTTTAINMETLKGADKLLVEKLGAKWNYDLSSVIYSEYTKEYVGEYRHENKQYSERDGLVYAFSMADLKYLNGKGPKPQHKFTGVPFVVSKQKGKLLYHNKDEGAEHTGNDSRPAESDSVYFHAAVILTRK